MNGNTLLAGGERSTGGELVMPLNSFFKELNTMFDKQNKVLSNNNNNNQPIVVQVTLDGKVVAQSTIKNMKEMSRLGTLDTSWL